MSAEPKGLEVVNYFIADTLAKVQITFEEFVIRKSKLFGSPTTLRVFVQVGFTDVSLLLAVIIYTSMY